jgi:osmoprotectant transport system ATP-binding protein
MVVSKANLITIRRKIGYVIQEGGLFPHLTAEENILLMAKHLKLFGEKTSLRLTELCDMMKFPLGGLTRFPVELSGGQRQRVSLMRALILDPDYLLMDEPFGALDPMVRSSLQSELKIIFSQLGKTVLFVTHDMAEAGFLADEIILLGEGSVIQAGSLEDLRSNPVSDYVTQFINSQRRLVDF